LSQIDRRLHSLQVSSPLDYIGAKISLPFLILFLTKMQAALLLCLSCFSLFRLGGYLFFLFCLFCMDSVQNGVGSIIFFHIIIYGTNWRTDKA
jgi:hypothetical protein